MDTKAKFVLVSPTALSEPERADLEAAINASLAQDDPTGETRCSLSVPSPRTYALDPLTGTVLLGIVLKGGAAAAVTRLILAVANHVRGRSRVIEIQAGPNLKLAVHPRLFEEPGVKKNILDFLQRMGALGEPGAETRVEQLLAVATVTQTSPGGVRS
jgi:hypothetical protein